VLVALVAAYYKRLPAPLPRGDGLQRSPHPAPRGSSFRLDRIQRRIGWRVTPEDPSHSSAYLFRARIGSVIAHPCEHAAVPVVLVSIDLCGLSTAQRDERLTRAMAIWLLLLRWVDVENANTDSLSLHNHVERVAIYHVRHASLKDGGMSYENEARSGSEQ
jgi:hypothetical protein